jgi:hypothetical protein
MNGLRKCDIYIYTMEYYSDINKNEILSFTDKWLELEIMLSEVCQLQKDQGLFFITPELK